MGSLFMGLSMSLALSDDSANSANSCTINLMVCSRVDRGSPLPTLFADNPHRWQSLLIRNKNYNLVNRFPLKLQVR